MLRHKTRLINLRRLKLYQASDYNGMKLEISHKKYTEKHTKTWKLNNMLLNNEWVNNVVKKKIKDTLKQMKVRTQQSKLCGTLGKQS